MRITLSAAMRARDVSRARVLPRTVPANPPDPPPAPVTVVESGSPAGPRETAGVARRSPEAPSSAAQKRPAVPARELYPNPEEAPSTEPADDDAASKDCRRTRHRAARLWERG